MVSGVRPEHFVCFCGEGQQWWDPQHKANRCSAPGCTTMMTEDPALDMIGVWDGRRPDAPLLARGVGARTGWDEGNWARLAARTTPVQQEA